MLFCRTSPHAARHRFQAIGERLEHRSLLSAVPFGATQDDTAEFMLGSVLVSLVLFESDGTIDKNTQDWGPVLVKEVKNNLVEGSSWWKDTLALQKSRHDLEFKFDFTYADQPVTTGYEPISRKSDDFPLWMEDFFRAADVPEEGGFSERIRAFNHRQRETFETNWAFTAFVVNAETDGDRQFALGSSFFHSFAYAGGRFLVTNNRRPASSFAHEIGHIFWAMDEYAGGKSYFDHRGYYNTQNLNGFDNNPTPEKRVASLMATSGSPYLQHQLSPTAMEMIGWRDSDSDGIFDVLDVPHRLTGQGSQDLASNTFHFQGLAEVQTLPNQNPSGLGNDITINRIRQVQVRFDQTPDWQTAVRADGYQVALDFQVPVPPEASWIEIRALDTSIDLASNIVRQELKVADASPWRNRPEHLDVNDDGFVTPVDALLVINFLNEFGSVPLSGDVPAPPYLDTNGDRVATPVDALLVINYLNETPSNDLIRTNAIAQIAVETSDAAIRIDSSDERLLEGESTGREGAMNPAKGDPSRAASLVLLRDPGVAFGRLFRSPSFRFGMMPDGQFVRFLDSSPNRTAGRFSGIRENEPNRTAMRTSVQTFGRPFLEERRTRNAAAVDAVWAQLSDDSRTAETVLEEIHWKMNRRPWQEKATSVQFRTNKTRTISAFYTPENTGQSDKPLLSDDRPD